MLSYTGHPLVDVGIATLTAFANKVDPETLDQTDLDAASHYLEALYTTPGPLPNLLHGMVLLNTGYRQASAIRDPYVQRTLYGWRTPADPSAGRCSFCERPAAYRANREDIPLLNGRQVYNFSGRGRAGLPVCGLCSLALHMLPLGCIKTGGGLLAAHSDDPTITYWIARKAHESMRKAISLADMDKIPGQPFERTRFIELFVSWLARRDTRAPGASLTGYLFSSGKTVAITIFHLDAAVIGWLDEVLHNADVTLTQAWQRAVEMGWRAGKTDDPEAQRNLVYEALLRLPDDARDFLRRFLRPTYHHGLVGLFLERILDMSHERIALLRELGDRFTSYARARRGFFFEFARAERYADMRRRLLRAADDASRDGSTLITFDEFVEAFTAPEGEVNDWRLARDLIVLRMIEQMHIQPDDEPVFDITEDNETEAEGEEA